MRVARLEELLGVQFPRTAPWKGAHLTGQGQVLLAEARQVLGRVDHLRAAGLAFAEKVEPELSISVSPIFPLDAFAAIAYEMRERFPHTLLRVFTAGISVRTCGTSRLGARQLGITGLSDLPSRFVVVPCGPTAMAKVGRPSSPVGEALARAGPRRGVLKKASRSSSPWIRPSSRRTFQLNVLSLPCYQMALAGAGWTSSRIAHGWLRDIMRPAG